ncbi:hypothetical protein VIGAN_06102100, partial [Vigna angularis var. angularis]
MALVKVTLVAIVFALIACNGFVLGKDTCNENKDCKGKVALCRDSALCVNNVCQCPSNILGFKDTCNENKDCKGKVALCRDSALCVNNVCQCPSNIL